MNANDAKQLTLLYHDKRAALELEDTLKNIEMLAEQGKTEYFTMFKYNKNVDKLRELGYSVEIRSIVPNESLYKVEEYYDIKWGE